MFWAAIVAASAGRALSDFERRCTARTVPTLAAFPLMIAACALGCALERHDRRLWSGGYAIHRAPAGADRVRSNGYDADRLGPNGRGHVLVRLIRDSGRPGERQIMVAADLSLQKGGNRNREDETRPVATLTVARSPVR